MDTRVELKICEACGSLFYRDRKQQGIYCLGCDRMLKDFPTVETRKLKGRPGRKGKVLAWIHAVEDEDRQ